MKFFFALAVMACLLALASADCKVSVTQTLGSAWTTNGQDMSQWSVTLTNTGSEAVKSVELSITGAAFDHVWNINQEKTGLWALPDYIIQGGGIAAGANYQFGYIIKSKTQASITVATANCGSAASASPAAPSASASPAAPSASASPAAASPSPSTVVSTPQPTGCQATVESVARSAASGGVWTEGDSTFQIYDLTIKASGNAPITGVQLTIDVASGASVYQYWNLQAQANSNVYVVPTPWGAIQVGASQGAGIIVKSKTGQAVAAPVVKVQSASCPGSPSVAPSAAPSSAPASPSPSTIVATPQPSAAPAGCSVSVTLVARSAASGGQWTDANGFNQIFDVTVTNSGTKAVTGGQVQFGFASGVKVAQFWELNRKDANTFTLSTAYGPIQVGASQGAGLVASTTSASSIALPSVTVSAVTCN